MNKGSGVRKHAILLIAVLTTDFSASLLSGPVANAATESAVALSSAREESPSAAQVLINRMGTEPWRYGGLSPSGKNRVVVGLRRDGDHGIAGEYALLDHELRALTFGPITGTFDMPTAAGASVHCRMTVPLRDRVLTLEGTCSPGTLGGSIATRRKPVLLNAQFDNFLAPDMSTAQYWLTTRGFSEAFQADSAIRAK